MIRYATHTLARVREELENLESGKMQLIDLTSGNSSAPQQEADGEPAAPLAWEDWKMRPAASNVARVHTLNELLDVDDSSLQLQMIRKLNAEAESKAASDAAAEADAAEKQRLQYEESLRAQSQQFREQVDACERRAVDKKLLEREMSDERNHAEQRSRKRMEAAIAVQAAKDEARRRETQRLAARRMESTLRVAREVEEMKEEHRRSSIAAEAEHDLQSILLELSATAPLLTPMTVVSIVHDAVSSALFVSAD